MTMRVKIKELSFQAIIGILPFERKQEQVVLVNCSFKYKYAKGKFVDYAKVANTIKTHIQQKEFELLEDAILSLKKSLKKSYKIKKIKLCIAKPTILDDCIVEVSQ